MNVSAPNILLVVASLPKKFLKKIEDRIDNKLFRFCLKHHSKLSSYDKEIILEQLYEGKNKKQSQASLRGLKNHLKGKLERELYLDQLEQMPLFQKDLILRQLIKLPNAQSFFSYAHQYIEQLKEKSNKGLEEYQMLSDWCRNVHLHPDHNKFKGELNYLEASDSFKKQASVLVDLRDYTEWLGHDLTKNDKSLQKISRKEVEVLLTKAETYKEITTFNIYLELIRLQLYCLYSMKTATEFEYSQILKLHSLLLQSQSEMSDVDFQISCSKLIQILLFAYERFDYCNQEVKASQAYVRKMFELYEMMDKEALLLHCNRLSFSSYVSIVIVSAGLGEFDWCEKFIRKYKKYLFCDQKEDAINFARAYQLYYQGNYKESLKKQEKISNRHIFFKFHCRLLHLFCLYEQYVKKEIVAEKILSKIDSTRLFIHREDLLKPSRKEAFNQTLRFTKRLVLAEDNPNFSQANYKTFKKTLISKKPVVSKPWLLEKLETIAKRLK